MTFTEGATTSVVDIGGESSQLEGLQIFEEIAAAVVRRLPPTSLT